MTCPISFPEPKCLLVSTKTRSSGTINFLALIYMASRDKVDVDAFHKSIQYALERLGKSKFGSETTVKAKDTWALGTSLLIIPELRVLVLTKRQLGSGNDIALMRNCFLSADRKR